MEISCSGRQLRGAATEERKAVTTAKTLIMKGGGIKGLAFAGALIELERFYRFETYVGTSAGAIAAVLLAAGYSASDLRVALERKDFEEFRDGRLFKIPWNLLVHRGAHPGEVFRRWVKNLIGEKVPRLDRIPMSALPSRAVIYAAWRANGTLIFDSHGENSGSEADFAVRCSMSLPFVFFPQVHDGHRVFDGGLLNNFPVQIFLERNPGTDFLALYLGSSAAPEYRPQSMLRDVFDILLGRDDLRVVNEFSDRTVVIDPSPIKTTDFSLSAEEKEFLILQGRASALAFLADLNLPGGPSAREATRAKDKANEAKDAAKRVRRRRARLSRARNLSILALSVLAIVVLTRPGLDWRFGWGREELVGGPGGEDFERTCANTSDIIQGIYGQSDSGYRVSGLGLLCGPLTGEQTTPGEPRGTVVLDRKWTEKCDAGAAVAGIEVGKRAFENQEYVNSVRTWCVPVPALGQQATREGRWESDGKYSMGGRDPQVLRCNDGEYVVAILGRSGDWIDALGIRCAPLKDLR